MEQTMRNRTLSLSRFTVYVCSIVVPILLFDAVGVDAFGLVYTWRGTCSGRSEITMTAKGFGKATPAAEKKRKTAKNIGKAGGKDAPATIDCNSYTITNGGSAVNGNTNSFGRSGLIKENVMQQTETAIRQTMDELRMSRPFVWEALELKKKLTMWQAQTAGLNVLQTANLPPQQVRDARAAEAKLRQLQGEHNIGDRLLHNIAQEATWDASARVKDERQASTELPPAVAEHMQAVVARSGAGGDSRILDVGTGTGILLRFLQGAGVRQEHFVGVDLSSGMVDVAKTRYPRATFVQGDFLDYRDDGGEEAGFTHVFFNCCLHNFLEPGEALATAARLLREGGRIVISHPKGAANVEKQRRANPMLVPNRLPTERDLENACEAIPALTEAGMRVIPHTHQVGGRTREGYLQILQSFTGDSAQA